MELSSLPVFRQARQALQAADRYTSPRSTTAGNFERPNLFQSACEGATEGFYLMDLPGLAIQGSAGVAAVLARRLGDNPWVGALAGTATGAAVGAATTLITGGSPVAMATCGAMLGTYTGLRADSRAVVRDGGVNGLILASPFFEGPAKVVGGLGALLGAQFPSEKKRLLVGALAGCAVGTSLAAAGVIPMDPLMAGLACTAASGLGAVVGPRTSQFFRNLAEDIGERGRALRGETPDTPPSTARRWARTLGVIPLSFGKEMVLAGVYGDGAFLKGLLGGAVDAVQQGNIMFHAREEKEVPGPNEEKPSS
ncbi:MAG: hypothetical protein AMXMBFR33_18630 [Candidatus Xenobia bacterium]